MAAYRNSYLYVSSFMESSLFGRLAKRAFIDLVKDHDALEGVLDFVVACMNHDHLRAVEWFSRMIDACRR